MLVKVFVIILFISHTVSLIFRINKSCEVN